MTALKQSGAMAVAMGASEGMNLPRYGEFNTQDIVNLASDATAKVASLTCISEHRCGRELYWGSCNHNGLERHGNRNKCFQ